jgi:hypothetical protein
MYASYLRADSNLVCVRMFVRVFVHMYVCF